MPAGIRRTCRYLSSASISTATRSTAEKLLEEVHHARPVLRSQLIDANQLQRLSLALNRPDLYRNAPVRGQLKGPPNGTPVPPGYHLAYFTPALLPGELGPDGADVTFNPPPPFTRRMWAGGYITWEKDNPLRVGQDAIETTKLVSAEPKRTRAGQDMIVVGVQKSFENDQGLSLVDRRDWVFRHARDAGSTEGPLVKGQIAEQHPLPDPQNPTVRTRDFLQTPASLFRFSALTFNGHMIHYSLPWASQVEGHPEIVVHGPLNLINILDFWRDEVNDGGYSSPASIRYKATSPFYAGMKYRALLELNDKTTFVRLCDSDANNNMRTGMVADLMH